MGRILEALSTEAFGDCRGCGRVVRAHMVEKVTTSGKQITLSNGSTIQSPGKAIFVCGHCGGEVWDYPSMPPAAAGG